LATKDRLGGPEGFIESKGWKFHVNVEGLEKRKAPTWAKGKYRGMGKIGPQTFRNGELQNERVEREKTMKGEKTGGERNRLKTARKVDSR